MKKALDCFRRLEYILLVIPVAFLCVCIVINIFMRAFLDSGLSWLEEISRYIFVFQTFLGASIAVSTDQHPKMTAVVDALPHTARQIVLAVGNLLCAALCLLVAFYGYQQILRMISNGAMASSVRVPMYVPYLIIPLGTLMAAVRYLILVFGNVKALFRAPSAAEEAAAKGGDAT
nr:TRAP transporter small permease [uncultured Oscillibacter sp.]